MAHHMEWSDFHGRPVTVSTVGSGMVLVDVLVEGRDTSVMLDTGAECSLVHRHALEKWDYLPK